MSAHWPVVILGGSGYVAGEMLRLVLGHPNLTLAASVSTSQAGQPVGDTFPHLAPALGDVRFETLDAALARIGESEHTVILSAAPHGESAAIIAQALARATALDTRVTVVDASADFRFADPAQFEAIYGKTHPHPGLLADFTCAVPEHTQAATAHAAQPGCFATSMLLAIVPLIASGITEPRFLASAVTGSTGAGRTPRPTTHHPERQSNLFAYQALQHRHQPEVCALTKAATGHEIELGFVPHSGPFARGIHATLFANLLQPMSAADVNAALTEFYADSALVRVDASPPRLKDVAGSCYARLNASVQGETVVVCSVLDNLLKGAAGGCLQWVNRLLGLPEATGLTAPATGWI